jgi:diguanylate cyclase (GGDEF)-like protein/PAS domain S-box-containing protein
MHRLLNRQLQRHIVPELRDDARLGIFLNAIDHYYDQVEEERFLLENALRLSSQELSQVAATAKRDQMLLRGVMDSIPDMIFFKSSDGCYLGCNRAFERIHSLSETQVVGKTDFDLMPVELATDLYACDQQVLTSGREYLSKRWITNQEHQHQSCVEVLRTPFFGADGQVKGLIGIGRDITERKHSEEAILHQANYDSLTELANRRFFHERLLHEIKLSKRSKLPIYLVMIDLDKFKQINDELGHDAGDALLIEVARRIKCCVRETDIVARLGGDEFIVAIANIIDPKDVKIIAQKLVDALVDPFLLGIDTALISGSLGIACYPNDAQDIETLVKHADQAMYYAKKSGRNRYCFFTPTQAEAAIKQRQLM